MSISNNRSNAAATDLTLLFAHFSNIFPANLSAFDWLADILKAYDNNSSWVSDMLLDSNNHGIYERLCASLALMFLEDAHKDIGGERKKGGNTTLSYSSDEPSDGPAARYRAAGVEAPTAPPGIAFSDSSSDVSDIIPSNIAHFAQALNEHLLVMIADANGRITYVNEKLCTVFKYASWELLGFLYRGINSECHSDDYLSEIWRTIRQGEIWKGDIQNRAKDGAMHWLEAIIIPCSDCAGKIYQYLAICIDITARKRNEEALCASRNELRALANHLETAQECERKRIAREIHDELGQHLLALKMDVSRWGASELAGNPKLTAKVQRVLQGIDETMLHVKSIINDLRPAALELGLADAVQSHVRIFERRSGIPCELSINDENIELENEKITVLFRVLQESLVNVSRHARASRVGVALCRNADCVLIEVSDNGKGMQVDKHNKRNSFGLLGMRERIAALGGVLTIEAAAGGGTKLTASLPI